jgi:CubicO group peptidase (beta-lactamase class C family)
MNAVIVASVLCACAPRESRAADAIDEYVTHEMQSKQIPGLAFAVVQHGQVTIERAYGLANIETGTPVRTSGVFEIASVTKPFTATAVMMLVEEGKIKLGDPISKFLERTPPSWRDITVQELLSHTSGLRGGGWVEWDSSPLLKITTKQMFDDIAKSPLVYASGAGATYSDPGFFLLGMIIEKVSGIRYSEFMARRIFAPVGMENTGILDRRTIIKNHVSCYELRGGQLQNDRRVWEHELPSYFGMVSTVGDLAKWNIALDEGRVLKRETLAQMWTPTKLKNGSTALVDGEPYGLGWMVDDLYGHRVVAHPGFTGCIMIRFLGDDFTIIVLTNLDATTGPHELTLALGITERLRPELAQLFPR